jgi:SNF2 family DNA or RNA helicase
MTNVFIMFVVFRLVIQLNLLETPLQNLGLNFVRLDGSMSQSQREKSLRLFNENKDIKIFLVSIKAGGLGLNLVAASRVLLLDPWWNRMLIFSILNVQFLF